MQNNWVGERMISEKADTLMRWLNNLKEVRMAHKDNAEFLKKIEEIRDVLAQELLDELDGTN